MRDNLSNKSFLLQLSVWILLFVVACGTSDTTVESSMRTVQYVTVDDLFPNPERGFYKYSTSMDALSEEALRKFRKDNITLMYRFYYLKNFRHAPLSQEFLNRIDEDMTVFRKAGFKTILRFAYSDAAKEPDAPLDIILGHLDQLKPVLDQNKDVIAAMHAGFIGSWGEWYYSTNQLNTDDARKAVLDKILEVLPANRFVQVRKPYYKQKYVGESSAIRSEDAFGLKAVARIGHHNDCFLASVDDVGTYIDVVADKKYLNGEGLYVPVGGETCPPEGVDPANCAKAQSEMRYLRWSYLNRDYYEEVNNNWIVEGCMGRIVRDMGYRLTLQKGVYSAEHAPGSDLSVNISIRNVGYAPMFNPRRVELILRSNDKSRIYSALLSDDPRRWQPGNSSELKAKAALPKDIPSGDYRLYLFLPDPEPTLSNRPEYAVRLANRDCWEETTGYNDLGVNIRIEASLDLPQSTSTIKFVLKN